MLPKIERHGREKDIENAIERNAREYTRLHSDIYNWNEAHFDPYLLLAIRGGNSTALRQTLELIADSGIYKFRLFTPEFSEVCAAGTHTRSVQFCLVETDGGSGAHAEVPAPCNTASACHACTCSCARCVATDGLLRYADRTA